MLKEVQSTRELKSFIYFPFWLNADNNYWIKPNAAAVKKYFNRNKNPFYNNGDARLYVAMKDRRVAGRVAIFANRTELASAEKTVRFGCLDFENDREVSAALVEGIIHSAKELGAKRMLGCTAFVEGNLTDAVKAENTKYNLPETRPSYFFSHLQAHNFQLKPSAYFFAAEANLATMACQQLATNELRGYLLKQLDLPTSLKNFEINRLIEAGEILLSCGGYEVAVSLFGAKPFALLQKKKYKVASINLTPEHTRMQTEELVSMLAFLKQNVADKSYIRSHVDLSIAHPMLKKAGSAMGFELVL